jgi:lipoprotein-releasing system permease protein
MIVIEKRKDIAVWQVLGAEKGFIQKIFIWQGLMIALTGGIIGLILGYLLCFLQEKYGFVKMNITSTIVDAYPVRMDWLDFVFTFFTIVVCTWIVAWFPAKNALKTDLRENL